MKRRVGVAVVLIAAGIAACGDGDPVGLGVEVMDLTGDWTLVVDAVCTGSISIAQQGITFDVSGSVGGGLCPFSATGAGSGALEDSSIRFGLAFGSGSDETGSGLGSVEFEGAVAENGNRMTGTYSNQSGLSGQWEAVRQ